MLIGHQKQWQFLKKSAEAEKNSHAYLFCGLEKLGKRTLALQWASFLFKEKSSCQPLKILDHPDLILIEPRPNKKISLDSSSSSRNTPEGKGEIQVSQIRELVRSLSLKPSFAPFKIAIIDEAHLMNQESQSCLLKTLEEPRGRALLILISHKSQYLLPTIISRLQILRFSPLKRGEIENCLTDKGLSAEEVKKISEIALGRPGVALDLAFDKERLERFNRKIVDFDKVSGSPIFFRFEYAKNLAENARETKETLDIWLSRLRSILLSRFLKDRFRDRVYGEEAERLKNPSTFSSEKPVFAGYSTAKLKNIIDQIEEVKFLLSSTNVNSRLALETLLMAI